MFVTPSVVPKKRKLYNVPLREEDYRKLSRKLDREILDKDINLIFELDIYMNNVFTTQSQVEFLLANIEENSDPSKEWIIGLVGIAGAGHFTPAYQMARALKENYNVMLIDPIMVYKPNMAYQNSEMWNFIARKIPQSWRIVREFMSHEVTSDLFYQLNKMKKQIIFKLIKKLDVYGVFSTFTFTNTIMPEISHYVEKAVIAIPDVSPVGFANVPYRKEFSNEFVDYIVISNDSAMKMKQLYPSFCYNEKRIHIAGNTPCFMDFPDPCEPVLSNTMLASLGSAVGIGQGIKILPSLLANFEGTLVLDCGSNQKWKQTVQKYLAKHPDKVAADVIVTGCISPSLFEELFRRCEITLEKCGGSAGSQTAVKSGVTGISGSIKGQEEDNEKHWNSLGVISLLENERKLREFLHKRPYSPGLRKVLGTNTTAIDVVLETFQK